MTNQALAQEIVPDDEAQSIQQLIEILSAKIIKEKEADNIVRRDAHPKMHGLVKADFIIEPNLPPDLAVGLFAKPATYPAWIRFSNQNAERQADGVPDVRGMAVKLMGVPGKKLLEGEENAMTHDFITISGPNLVSSDAADFLALLKAFTANPLAIGLFCLTHPKTTLTILTTFKNFSCPLKTRYWSTTPYLFGAGRAAKYCFTPAVIDAIERKPDLADNFLRQSLVKHLTNNEAWFDFCVQIQTDVKTMPIENANAVWPETVSPFRKVARVRIMSQQFATPTRDQYGENLSFNPWHALPEHRPLGGVNRARGQVYTAISKVRHAHNGTQRIEPDHYEID